MPVHAPSAFTQLLADALPDCSGLSALDAGCGAGAVTVALLERGAERVTALDSDPAALELTAQEVTRRGLGARVELVHGRFGEPPSPRADLAVMNPGQRPAAVYEALPPEERWIHRGGGPDGMDTLRLVLGWVAAPAVLSTLSSLVSRDPGPVAAAAGWSAAPVLTRPVRHAEPWRAVAEELEQPVTVWRFERRPGPVRAVTS
ncbi:MAG TPA: methyltransferase domain-containing protein [Capillimicrobium sp.]|jgi:SAM-dependent methyltransferase